VLLSRPGTDFSRLTTACTESRSRRRHHWRLSRQVERPLVPTIRTQQYPTPWTRGFRRSLLQPGMTPIRQHTQRHTLSARMKLPLSLGRALSAQAHTQATSAKSGPRRTGTATAATFRTRPPRRWSLSARIAVWWQRRRARSRARSTGSTSWCTRSLVGCVRRVCGRWCGCGVGICVCVCCCWS